MAFIGMRHVVGAAIATHTDGSEPTYSAGCDMGKAISGNLTINRNDNPLYADDVIAEDDNSITSMELELGLDDLDEDTQDKMGLIKKVTSTTDVTTYYNNDAPGADMGVGYIRVRRRGGTTTFQAVWIYKAKFSMTAENTQTKGESIEWQTPTVTGRCAGIDMDGTGARTFRKVRNYDTETAATAWLDGLAGITRT